MRNEKAKSTTKSKVALFDKRLTLWAYGVETEKQTGQRRY